MTGTPLLQAPIPTRRVLGECLVASLIALLLFGVGLDNHGVTNWQEAQRLLVARDMQERGDWMVPTVHGEPYLAKPPLIYWATIALAEASGSPVDLWALRLVVALSGALAVGAVYVLAIVATGGLARPPTRRVLLAAEDQTHWRLETARWSAALLATAILHTRSSRIGELDVLLAAPVCLAVAATIRGWHSRRPILWAGLAASAAIPAVLAKGPPGVLPIAAATILGPALCAARRRDASRSLDFGAIVAGAIALPGAAIALAGGIDDPLGLALLALIGGGAAWLIARLALIRALVDWFFAMSRAHPVGVLVVPAGAFWLWWRALPEAATASAVQTETADNLRLLVQRAPVVNLEALAYGAGLGSIAFLLALVWIVRDRPRLPAGFVFIAAWIIGLLVALSILGKGVARYLTPIWPALCLIGAAWLTTWLADHRRAGIVRAALIAAVAALALGQAWWYADGRERFFADRVPDEFIAELQRDQALSPDRLATLEFRTPAVDWYAGGRVISIGDIRQGEAMAGAPPLTIGEFIAVVRDTDGPWIVLARETPLADQDARSIAERLGNRVGVELIPVSAPWRIDSGRSAVVAWRITPVEP